ncbi:MAG: CARDB domain-containing protein, partial [Bacteroidota bacterium]
MICLLIGIWGGSHLSAQISYQWTYQSQAGNPGGLNLEQDFVSSGWSVIMLGGINTNQWSGAMSLPFTFNYFGQNFSTFRVSANGLMTFGGGTGGLIGNNLPLPTGTLPDYTIACYWDEFTNSPPLPLNDVVQMKSFGTAPNRQFWIRWASYEWASANFVYLAIVLEETTGNIYLVDQYSSPSSTGLTTTVGLQKNFNFAVQASSSIGLTGATSAAFDNSYYQFEPYPIPPEDIIPQVLNSPTADACGLGSESVSIRLQNQGQLTASSIEVGYSLDGVTLATEVIPGSLSPGGTINYTFNQPLNLTQAGSYRLMVWGSTSNDGDKSNDTLTLDMTRVNQVSSFPYQEDFESGDGGWMSGGSKSTWELGTPNKSTITGAASGTKAWVTGRTSDYESFESSYVISPCFDFTQLGSQSTFSMWVWWESESPWDGATLQSSVDGGSSWQVIGEVSPDWFNSTFVASLPGGQSLGWTGRQSSNNGSGGWRQVSQFIPASLIGKPEVRLRVAFSSNGSVQGDGFAFDRVVIGNAPGVELGPDRYFCQGGVLDAGNPGLVHQWSTGASGQTLTLTNPGPAPIIDSLITVTVTNSLGLSDTDSIYWSMAAPMQPQIASVIPVSCFDLSDGSIDTEIQGGTAPFVYQWSQGSQAADPDGLAAGWYTAQVQDVHGCPTEIDSVEVTQPARLEIQGLISHVACYGGSTGSIELSAQGGNGGYQWTWTDGPQGANRNNLSAGSYTVNLVDGKDCELERSFTVEQADSIQVSLVSLTDATCPDGQDGRLEVSVNGGSTPYLLTWSHGPNGNVAPNLAVGTYTVTVEDSANCQQESQAFEIAYQDSAPTAKFGFELDKDVLTLQDSSQGASSYLWTFGDGEESNRAAPTYQYGDTG